MPTLDDETRALVLAVFEQRPELLARFLDGLAAIAAGEATTEPPGGRWASPPAANCRS